MNLIEKFLVVKRHNISDEKEIAASVAGKALEFEEALQKAEALIGKTIYFAGESTDNTTAVFTSNIKDARHHTSYPDALADIRHIFEHYPSMRESVSLQIEKIFVYGGE